MLSSMLTRSHVPNPFVDADRDGTSLGGQKMLELREHSEQGREGVKKKRDISTYQRNANGGCKGPDAHGELAVHGAGKMGDETERIDCCQNRVW